MRLTIKNPSALIHTIVADNYKLDDIHEHPDRYVFEFHKEVSGTTYDIAEVSLLRDANWDDEYQKWMYKLVDRAHWVSADWFGIKENAIKTFGDCFK